MDELLRRIGFFALSNKPIKLVGFWGIGFKEKTNWADLASCKFLAEINKEVKKVYSPGIEFTFIFANNHAVHNGVKKEIINSYIKEMKRLFKNFGFKYVYLDKLWKKYKISFNKIDESFKSKPGGWWNKVENANLIEKNVSDRNLRLNSKTATQKYYIMRTLEKELLKREFSSSILFVFSDLRLKNVLPNMPTLYFYSRKGWSDSPWFVTK